MTRPTNARLGLLTCLSLACAPVLAGPAGRTPVWVHSHNRSAEDVYLLCGEHEARLLGTIDQRGSGAFEIQRQQRLCAICASTNSWIQ
jgi:hypothetical protein